MKKLGLFKRIGLTAATASACTAMAIAGFAASLPSAVALAEGEDELKTPSVSRYNIVSTDPGVNVKTEYNYGDKVSVPAGGSVTAPNGDDVALTDNAFVANQLGVYKVSYSDADDNVTYSFNVKVTLDEDYFLYVDYNGADIPTYVGNNKQITLPNAYVKYYDDDNVLQEYPLSDYTVTVKDSLNNDYSSNKTFNTANMSGKVFITYTARLGGETGNKYLSKTFTVNVQPNMQESTRRSNPTLAVSGIPKSASINRPVTLPVATATDNNDDNVKVEVKVTGPDGQPVKNVLVNDDGYAYETLENAVVFDNDKAMTFYPTQRGKYKVQYTAYNDYYDAQNPTAGGASNTSEATIEVEDHVAPVFKNTSSYEHLIPETWGLNVKDEAGTTQHPMNGKVLFKIPEVVDNATDVTEDPISIYFRITDSDNSKTVLTINNILSEGDDGTFKANSVYTADATFADGEFEFDFTKYAKVDSAGEKASLPGTYTVLYRARDKANNTSSKTYTITLRDTYEDTAKPTTAEVTAPDYLSMADEEFTIPYPVYADASDTRPNVVYTLYTDNGKEANSLNVKGGEVAKLVTKTGDNAGRYLVVNEGTQAEAELLLGSNLYYYVGVTDKVGNFRSNAVDGDNYIDMSATGADMTKIAAVTKLIPDTQAGDALFGYEAQIKLEKVGDGEYIYAGDNVNVGSFVITAANEDMRNYTGFEIAVYDPQGDYVDVTLETLSDVSDDGVAKIYVKDIRFNAVVPTDGDEAYTMTVRVFDVNGNSKLYGYKFSGVNARSSGNNQTAAIPNIGSSGNVNVKYKLNNEIIKRIPEAGTYRVVRKINGGTFSLMGSEFTALTASSYTIQDGYINQDDINGGNFDYDNAVKFNNGAYEGITYFNSVNTATPKIELLGVMPTYENKYDASKNDGAYVAGNGLVTIPQAIAYTENGMGEVEIDVKDPDGGDVDLDGYSFKADKDGAYQITYTATYENGEKATAEYTVNVGDVIAPQFTLTANTGTSTTGTLREGATFTYKTMEVSESTTTGITVRKEIYDPSHELMSSNTVSGSYANYRDKTNNGSTITLDKVGEYTVVYTAKDAVGNEYKITETVTVTSKGSSTPTTWTTLSTVLIIVAVVLLAGVIVYVVRFRKVKK